jgi:hypothetical protein
LTIDFGDVKPGQSVTESFTIFKLGDDFYEYTLTIEACPPAKDMTPYLLVWKDPAESESEPKANIDGRIGELTGTGTFTAAQNDLEDKWFVTFFVPPVLPVSETESNYECQISIKHNISTEPPSPLPPTPDPPPQSDLILRPNAAGVTYFTIQYPAEGEHWQKVAEEVSDGDVTYVAESASIQDNWDIYNIDDMDAGTNIFKITLCAIMRGNGTDMANGFFGFQSGGVGYWTQQKNLTTNYELYTTVWVTNPKTKSAWTVDDINALQVGFYVDSAANSGMYATQIFVVVDVTP